MNKDDIISLPNPHLRKLSTKFSSGDTEAAKKLSDEMIAAAISWEDSRPHEISAALAAVQVDKLKQLIIIRNDFEDKKDRSFTTLVNPKIIKAEGKIVSDFEGCLSVKDCYGNVPRHDKVRVKALDLDGNEVRIKATGFLARVLQHEIDHLNGVLFVDHIKDDPKAFYKLDKKGELQPVDYDEKIKNSILWD